EGQRMGLAVDSIVSPGCIISGGRIRRSILAPFVRVNSYSELDESILLPHANIGRDSRGRAATFDEGGGLPGNSYVGFDRQQDLDRGYVVTESGITVVPSPSAGARTPDLLLQTAAS